MKGQMTIKKVFGASAVAGLALTALVSGMAYGQGGGMGHGHGHGSLVPWIVHRMITPEQMHAAVAGEKSNIKTLVAAVFTARQQLTQDLVAGKDTTTDVTNLETAQNNLLAEKVKIAQNILANLSSSQRTQVSQFLTQWSSLKQTQHQQTVQLLQQFGGTSQSSSSQEAD
ncbi:MAG TPA: hypothetical protein VMB26_00145 [Candidatus Binataceae bacterium]|nr:hypothetical protein [Candidatus Binataceae bacterium]